MKIFFEKDICSRGKWRGVYFFLLSFTWFFYHLNATLLFKDTLMHHKNACLDLNFFKKEN